MSTLDADGCLWICLSPGCPELAAGELEAESLVEAGVPEALAALVALCAVVCRIVGDAQDRLAAVDPDLMGLLATRQV